MGCESYTANILIFFLLLKQAENFENNYDEDYWMPEDISPKKYPIKKRELNVSEMVNNMNFSELNEYNQSYHNCSNDYCTSDEEYIDLLEGYIFPQSYEWVLIALHSIVFIIGLIGNALVCVAVYRNHSMRTVTNYFIVNLALADFMVILFCLPPTVLWDVTETWFFGKAMCKIVLYVQVSDFKYTIKIKRITETNYSSN